MKDGSIEMNFTFDINLYSIAIVAAIVIFALLIIKGVFKSTKRLLMSLVLTFFPLGIWGQITQGTIIPFVNAQIEEHSDNVKNGIQSFFDSLFTQQPKTEQVSDMATLVQQYYVDPLTPDAKSNIKDGSVKYGATIILGDLDTLNRSTFAHIRVTDAQEPGTNGEKRNEKINVDPVGWRNFKIDGNWANNRLHLVGYQFSGLNDELRNLVTGTSYLNKGTESNGAEPGNPGGMLFYEQRLDEVLRKNKNYTLDLYVKPIYEGNNTTPSGVYMQWTFFDGDVPVYMTSIAGHSVAINNSGAVYLINQSPSYHINYQTGEVTAK